MHRLKLRLRYISQLIRSSYQPREYLRDSDDFATHVIQQASKLSRKVLERLQFNRVKVNDHSQIFVETCALMLHMNRRNLELTMGDEDACNVLLGMMPFCKKMTEYIINNRYPAVENFQDKFYILYLQREVEYYALDVVFGEKTDCNCVIYRYLNHLLSSLPDPNLPPGIMADLKEAAVWFLVQYEKSIRNELGKGYYLFVYKHLLFSS